MTYDKTAALEARVRDLSLKDTMPEKEYSKCMDDLQNHGTYFVETKLGCNGGFSIVHVPYSDVVKSPDDGERSETQKGGSGEN